MRFPVFASLSGYRGGWLRGDLVAGLTVWAVLVPEALAYATIAGVSPVVGLYAAPAALIFYAAFGSSRHLIVGPMSATAALSAATVAEFATAGSAEFVTLTATLAIAMGAVAIVAGVARLGFLAGFIPEAVQAAVVIAAVIELVDVPALVEPFRLSTRRLYSIYGIAARPDFIAAAAAMLGVLIFDTPDVATAVEAARRPIGDGRGGLTG